MDDQPPVRRFRLNATEGRPLFSNEFNKSRGVETGDLRNRLATSKTKVRFLLFRSWSQTSFVEHQKESLALRNSIKFDVF